MPQSNKSFRVWTSTCITINRGIYSAKWIVCWHHGFW